MNELINIITPFLYQHRYLFAFLGALFEGTNIMLLGGLLYKLGIFKFWNILIILLVGYFINGYGWYALGRLGGRKILERRKTRFLTRGHLRKLENYFKKHTSKALVITRITYGISSYVFILAGILKTKARQFFWCNFVATFIWVLMMFGIGYSFGASYELLSKIARVVAVWLVVVLFIVTILVAAGFVFWMRKKARVRFIENIVNYKGWETLKWMARKIYKFLDDNI